MRVEEGQTVKKFQAVEGSRGCRVSEEGRGSRVYKQREKFKRTKLSLQAAHVHIASNARTLYHIVSHCITLYHIVSHCIALRTLVIAPIISSYFELEWRLEKWGLS